jgi:LacI family transcriptional regulator
MAESDRRPTLKDVSLLAGTSSAVVSYVVNGGPRPVAEKTRAKVVAAIAQLGYRQNRMASALMSGRSNLVCLLVPDSSNPFFGEMARNIEQAASARNLLTVLGNTAYDLESEIKYEMAFSDLLPRVTFVTSIDTTAQSKQAGPRIYLHSRPLASTEPCVVFDDVGGGLIATEHLIEHGFTNIYCLTGPDDFGPSGRRKKGWEQAMKSAGLPIEGRVVRSSYSRLETEAVVGKLLASASPPRAIFATTDEQAIASLRAASVAGLRVPEDLAIVGFDGIQESLAGSVRLTTVGLPLGELASRAFEILEGWDDPETQKIWELSGTLVIGETCGCQAKSF